MWDLYWSPSLPLTNFEICLSQIERIMKQTNKQAKHYSRGFEPLTDIEKLPQVSQKDGVWRERQKKLKPRQG